MHLNSSANDSTHSARFCAFRRLQFHIQTDASIQSFAAFLLSSLFRLRMAASDAFVALAKACSSPRRLRQVQGMSEVVHFDLLQDVVEYFAHCDAAVLPGSAEYGDYC